MSGDFRAESCVRPSEPATCSRCLFAVRAVDGGASPGFWTRGNSTHNVTVTAAA